MDAILKVTKKYGIALIEDCSHAHGSTYKGQKVGTFGDIGCFSLDNNKILGAGEGGILITNSLELFERSLIISDFGPRIEAEITIPYLKKYKDTGFGLKHRIHPVSAAIANYELTQLERYIDLRLKRLTGFSDSIRDIAGLTPPHTRSHVSRGAFFGYRPFYDKSVVNNIDIELLIRLLQAEGMEVRQSGNQPLHLLPLFNSQYKTPYQTEFLQRESREERLTTYKKGDLPGAESFFESTLSIPTFTFETDQLLENYSAAFRKVFQYLSSTEFNLDHLLSHK
jgi:dTDP-4-amino-4,6-dideoxygalactose transaminase